MTLWLSFVIACLALIVAGTTAWLTFFRKGRIVMTQPTMVFFGPDGSRNKRLKNKVYLRTLLYCTAKRGQVIESLHVKLRRNETEQNFNIWVYGTKGELSRGSGLFVPQEGIAFDHHFLEPEDGANFKFLAGAYRLTVFAKLVGAKSPAELMTLNISISDSQAHTLATPHTGIFFDWGPDQQSYHPHTDSCLRDEPDTKQLLNAFIQTKGNE